MRVLSACAKLSIAAIKPRERVLDTVRVSMLCVCAVVWFVIFIPDPSVDFFLYTASILLQISADAAERNKYSESGL